MKIGRIAIFFLGIVLIVAGIVLAATQGVESFEENALLVPLGLILIIAALLRSPFDRRRRRGEAAAATENET